MKKELIEYIKKKFENVRIEEQELGTPEHGSIWIDVYAKQITMEIVIYPYKNEIGVSVLNEETIPFTGHDKIFNDVNDVIKYIEKCEYARK
jgi:hypothetical protein